LCRFKTRRNELNLKPKSKSIKISFRKIQIIARVKNTGYKPCYDSANLTKPRKYAAKCARSKAKQQKGAGLGHSESSFPKCGNEKLPKRAEIAT